MIAEAGYGDYFTHGLGHGIGLQVHEAPALRPSSDDVLQAGMVVTIEPGIYLPGWGGVGIEDDVLVTPDGCEVLTSVPQDLAVDDGRVVRSPRACSPKQHRQSQGRSRWPTRRPTTPSPFDVQTIKYLVALMSQHDLSEIDLRDGDQRIRLRRGRACTVGAASPHRRRRPPPPSTAPDRPPPAAARAGQARQATSSRSRARRSAPSTPGPTPTPSRSSASAPGHARPRSSA